MFTDDTLDRFLTLKGKTVNQLLDKQLRLNKKELLLALTGRNDSSYSGVYIFWWTGDYNDLPDNKNLKLVSHQIKPHNITWEKRDFPNCCFDKNRFPLYIGKTSDIRDRISGHLCSSTLTWKKNKNGTLNKKTTQCQFRSGIEHLFDYCGLEKLRREKFDFVTVTFLPIPDTKTGTGVKERFYLEDLAIGYFKPWFNVDSER